MHPIWICYVYVYIHNGVGSVLYLRWWYVWDGITCDGNGGVCWWW